MSVARGAVRCELMGVANVVPVILSRWHYGIRYDTEFDSEIHEEQDRWHCPDRDRDFAVDQIEWVVRKVGLRLRVFWVTPVNMTREIAL